MHPGSSRQVSCVREKRCCPAAMVQDSFCLPQGSEKDPCPGTRRGSACEARAEAVVWRLAGTDAVPFAPVLARKAATAAPASAGLRMPTIRPSAKRLVLMPTTALAEVT